MKEAAGGATWRVELALFLTLFFAYAYFCQGGGWNQNARFAQVRALVETGDFAINGYVTYAVEADADADLALRRRPLPERAKLPSDPRGLVSYDLAFHQGRLYPNKSPGASVLAAPAYWPLWRLEEMLGVDPDAWWPLTLNLYWVTVWSVGLIAALGAVLLRRMSARLFPELPAHCHTLAALSLGLGTLVFPFATLLFDHVATAFLPLLAFALLLPRVSTADAVEQSLQGDAGPTSQQLAAAGLVAGLAVVANYAALLTAGVLGLYALHRVRPRQRLVYFLLGGMVSGAFLMLYHQAAFGAAFVTANERQVAGFMNDEGRWLGILGPVDFRALFELLVGPYRGLFFSSPILILGLLGVERMIRRRELRAEGLVCGAVFLTVLAVNASFYRWDGGSTFAPRYLIPAIPFLALPLASWFASHPRLSAGLALLSALLMLLATSVTPQISVKIARPFTGYYVPVMMGRGPDPSVDPVSANRTGAYELDAGPQVGLFGPDSPQALWSSFNLGELLWPHQRLSLLPWLAGVGLGLGLLARASRRQRHEVQSPHPLEP